MNFNATNQPTHNMKKQITLIVMLLSMMIFFQCTENKPGEDSTPAAINYGGYESQIEWGEHLVTIGGCNDCHTPKKMTPHGPVLDSSLWLSGHPAQMPRIDVNRKERK